MPTYEYRCRKCKHQFELFHSIKDDKPKRCPKCRARADRVPAGGAGLLFKGSGFYITDYRSQSYRDKAKQEKSGGSGGSKEAGGSSGSGGSKESGGSSGSGSGGSGGTGGSEGSGRSKSRRGGSGGGGSSSSSS
jgi:putative FmdB family regulatory protein